MSDMQGTNNMQTAGADAPATAGTGIRLFPAVDILDRQVVRLLQGDYDKTTVYGDDPAAMIEPFKAAGASWVHVVDLNGARGETGVNDEVIKRLCAVGGIGVEVGGGVRSLERIEELAGLGVRRIVLGTKLARDHAFAQQAAERFGDLLVAGIDAREGRVAVQGWQEDGGMDALDLVARLKDWGYRHLVYTDIARDGMQTGIDPDLYARVAQAAGFPVVVSGGVSSLDDLRAACALGPEVIEGIITGRALYEGSFSLEDALAVVEG